MPEGTGYRKTEIEAASCLWLRSMCSSVKVGNSIRLII